VKCRLSSGDLFNAIVVHSREIECLNLNLTGKTDTVDLIYEYKGVQKNFNNLPITIEYNGKEFSSNFVFLNSL